MGTGKLNAGGNPAIDYYSIPSMGEVEIHVLLVASHCRNRDKFQPDEPLGSYADLPFNLSSHAYLGFGIFFSDCYSYGIAESSSNQCLNFICLGGREQALYIDNMVNCER